MTRKETIAEAFTRIRANQDILKALCQRGIDAIDANNTSYNLFFNDLFFQLRNCAENMPDASLFPGEWVLALNNYANSQFLEQTDYSENYTSIRAKLVNLVDSIAIVIPKNDLGYVAIFKLDESYAPVYDSINDESVKIPLRKAMQEIVDEII